MKSLQKIMLPLGVLLFVLTILSFVQIKIDNPLLLAERFVNNAGWLEIIVVSFYGSYLAYKMSDVDCSAKWRKISWSVFSIVFFSQLLLGILSSDKFLMTGKLHLPVPAMIICGPVYRGQISIMALLFLSTVVLTGPAWCSHLCYFGAIDNIFSNGHTSNKKLKRKMPIKFSLLFLVIAVTLLLRWFKVDSGISTMLGILFGVLGLLVIIIFTGKRKSMIHCVLYCPVGTLINYFRFVNPFRMYIDTSCTFCENCRSVCKYDALTLKDLADKKPGITCTLCGDCLSACKVEALKYKFFRLNPEKSRQLYLFLSISIHTIFLALARI